MKKEEGPQHLVDCSIFLQLARVFSRLPLKNFRITIRKKKTGARLARTHSFLSAKSLNMDPPGLKTRHTPREFPISEDSHIPLQRISFREMGRVIPALPITQLEYSIIKVKLCQAISPKNFLKFRHISVFSFLLRGAHEMKASSECVIKFL